MTGQESHMKKIYHVKDGPYPPCLQSGILDFLQLTIDEGVVLDTLPIMLEILNSADKLEITYEEIIYYIKYGPCPPCLWLLGTLNILHIAMCGITFEENF